MDRPLRVVSVLPSATEMLCFIGGGHLLVGRSHEDNYPESITHLPVVTGQLTEFTTAVDVDRQVSSALSTGQSLYTIDEQLLTSLQPDVILTQDICAVCAIDLQTVQRLASRMSPQPRVVSLNPLGLDDVLDNLLQVGEAVGMEREAQAARAGLEARLRRADELVATSQAAAAAAAAAQGPEHAAATARQCAAELEQSLRATLRVQQNAQVDAQAIFWQLLRVCAREGLSVPALSNREVVQCLRPTRRLQVDAATQVEAPDAREAQPSQRSQPARLRSPGDLAFIHGSPARSGPRRSLGSSPLVDGKPLGADRHMGSGHRPSWKKPREGRSPDVSVMRSLNMD